MAVTVVVLVCLLAGTVSAHHGVAAYDMERQVSLSGVVKAWKWTGPHARLVIDVRHPDGSIEELDIESAPLTFLDRNGWSKDTLQTGEKISIKIHPLKEGRGGVMAEVTKADGQVLVIRRPRF